MKCTCAVSTYPDGDAFKYDLEVTAYNDLVTCWSTNSYVKQLLILLVLPDDKDDWLRVGPEQLIARRAAYWYHPDPSEVMSENVSSVRIRIPLANVVSLSLFQDKFAEYYAV